MKRKTVVDSRLMGIEHQYEFVDKESWNWCLFVWKNFVCSNAGFEECKYE